jgi:hypothetical protein
MFSNRKWVIVDYDDINDEMIQNAMQSGKVRLLHVSRE